MDQLECGGWGGVGQVGWSGSGGLEWVRWVGEGQVGRRMSGKVKMRL